MAGLRVLLVAVLCVCLGAAILVAEGCSKPTSDTGTVAPPAKSPSGASKAQPAETKTQTAKGTTESAGATATPELKIGTTLENLQAAFDGESNAHARYLEFAKKADEEGYKQVALLFRAAARSEEIHARNHEAAITKLGGAAKADVKPADVKSTKENLEAAVKGETYEMKTMYPKFLEVARADKSADAIKSLNGAMKAEAEHAKLYKEALDNLDAWKTIAIDLYVCPVCGYTTKTLDFAKCPVCSTDASKFEKIK